MLHTFSCTDEELIDLNSEGSCLEYSARYVPTVRAEQLTSAGKAASFSLL